MGKLPRRLLHTSLLSLLVLLSCGQWTPAAASAWPDCQEKDVVIRVAGQPCNEDLTPYLRKDTKGCLAEDCSNTDKFAAASATACARMCRELDLCKWWSFGEQDGAQKCFLRVGDKGREASAGWPSGAKACAPEADP